MKGKRYTGDAGDAADGEHYDVLGHSKTDRFPTVKRPSKWNICEDILFAVLAVVPALLITSLLWLPILFVGSIHVAEVLMPYLVPPIAVPIWIWMMKRRVGRFKFPKPELISLGFQSAAWALLCAGVLVVLLSLGSGKGRKINQVLPQLKRDADIPAIREWMESYRNSIDINAEMEKHGSERIYIDDVKLPECISVLDPRYASYDAETKCLRLHYSDGFWYWGLVIAAKDSPLYEKDQGQGALEDGAWVWAGQRQ